MTKLKYASLLGAALVAALPSLALAQGAGDIADDLRAQATQFSELIGVLSFVIGAALGIAGLLKFRAHSQNPNDPSNKLSTAFMLIFVGAAMVALPSLLGSGIETIWTGGGTTNDANGGFTAL